MVQSYLQQVFVQINADAGKEDPVQIIFVATCQSGKIVNKEYGPFMRYCFIITDAPLECDEELTESICDGCGACASACSGHAISKAGLDTWQCSVYYKGAHKSNPFMTEEFLKDHPERDAIYKHLVGEL